MYDNLHLQQSQLVRAARKAETEALGGSALEARVKSAVVELEAQANVASSDQSYEVITQQIMYLMSAITNQNLNNCGQNGSNCNDGGGKFSKPQRPNKDRKDMIYWCCGGTGHGWRECLIPREGNSLPFKLANHNLNGRCGKAAQTSNPPSVPARKGSESTNN